MAGFANGVCVYDFIDEYAAECTVASSEFNELSGNCDVDVDECASGPCANGATCIESASNNAISAHSYRCTCVAGFASGLCEYDYIGEFTAECTVFESSDSSSLTGNCDIDVDECASSPCINGATCTESAVESEVSFHAYQCTCVDGFANGVCEYDYISEYEQECIVMESTQMVNLTGNCDIDVDECASSPCQNNATCHNYVSDYECDCQEIINPRTGEREAWEGEHCEIEIFVCDEDEDDCDPLYAVCHHLGPGLHDCECHVGWDGDGFTCNDIDECASDPCTNGATCTESSCDPSSFPDGTECSSVDEGLPPIDSYSCACVAGFANGLCFEGWDAKADEYTEAYHTECTVALGGHCDVDIEECVSSPCANGAGCTDSHSGTFNSESISYDAFSCACRAGFANGVCAYDFIEEVAEECAVNEGAICDMDVDECASRPCANNATCLDSAHIPSPQRLVGASPSEAGRSCSDIYMSGVFTVSGTYYVDFGRGESSAVLAYCNFDIRGGGWTLLMKADYEGSTFAFSADYWTTDNVLNADEVSTTIGDAKYATFNDLVATEYLVVWPMAVDLHWYIGRFAPTTALEFFQTPRIVSNTPRDREDFSESWFGSQEGQQVLSIAQGEVPRVRFGYSWVSESGEVVGGGGVGLDGGGDEEYSVFQMSGGDYRLPSAPCCGQQAPNGNQAMPFLLYGRFSHREQRDPWTSTAIIRSVDD
eukprot:SAG31_NODE_4817_length_2935_cov_2.091678_2_plen_712_part_00